MPRRSRKADVNATPFSIVNQITGPPFFVNPHHEPAQPEKNPAAVALGRLGRLGGLKGGKARAASLTKKRRSEIARKAAVARWKK